MRNSDLQQKARQVLQAVILALDERRVAQLIDEPIDRAAAEFDHPQTVGSQDQFLEVTGTFVRHVTLSLTTRQLKAWQARADAISLLDEAYREAHGYDGALLDAMDADSAGVSVVLAALAEQLKARCRNAYVRRTLARAVDPADWYLQVALVEVMIRGWGPDPPDHLRGQSPEQLAGTWIDVLMLDQEVRKILHRPFGRMSTAYDGPATPEAAAAVA